MFLVGILSWWYGGGWLGRVRMIKARMSSSADFFSVELLASTLFAPFRQISAAPVRGGSINIKIQRFFDRLLSRVIGATVRTIVIIVGMVVMAIQMIFGLVTLLFWLVMPLIPVVGLILMTIGWVPR
jgi:hypothetical protein